MSNQDYSTGMLTSEQFKLIANIMHTEAGLEIPEQKNAMIYSRLSNRVRDLKFRNINQYCDFLSGPGLRSEISNLTSALTTNVTSFYRESHHFDVFANEIVPNIVRRAISNKPVRIWSAGCSEGMELLTAAIILLNRFPEAIKYDIRFLGTDIDQEIVQKARRAKYPKCIRDQLPRGELEKFFIETGDGYTATKQLLQLTTYNALNLIDAWPIKQKLDVIFCRNVAIYFGKDVRETLWPRFAQALSPDGFLFVGHSERITGSAEHKFELVGNTTYKLAQRPSVVRRSYIEKEVENGTT